MKNDANQVNQTNQKQVVVNMDNISQNPGNNVNKIEKKPKKIRYKYTVKDQNGKVINGHFDAFSKIDVHSFLLAQNYEIVNIVEDKISTKLGLAALAPRKKMRAKELNFFLTQLSTYIK